MEKGTLVIVVLVLDAERKENYKHDGGIKNEHVNHWLVRGSTEFSLLL